MRLQLKYIQIHEKKDFSNTKFIECFSLIEL